MQQEARFTLEMPFVEMRGYESRYFEHHVKKYHIPSTSKPLILKELLSVGISDGTVYYDLDSLSRSFKKVYNL